MKRAIGLLFLLAAIACGTFAYMKVGRNIELSMESSWIAYPAGALACLILGCLLLMRPGRAFGVVFCVAAAVCFLFAYENGGPAWGDSFDPRRMIRRGGHWAAIAGAVCLFVGLKLLLSRRTTVQPTQATPRT